ncbi:hypothetical protein [Streptomyces uncialis]|uniref:hypothetical protein n=1 Tax=Streptomyces uncialis TaxID=1048205 RepID=UPI00386B4344|nr:hypothetical protein OG268_01410 [Streptomyces uncialis]
MPDPAPSPWTLAWEMAHKQATGSPATLVQGYNIHLAGGAPSHLDSQPGQISAVITPRHGEPARATINITTLTTEEQQTLAAALTRTRHHEALLKGRLPTALADPARTGDVTIAPSPTQLTFACDCQQAPCQHTAALGHAVTRRLHTTPTLLTTLRGLTHRHLTDLLQTPDPAAATPGKRNRPNTPPRPAGPYITAHQAYQQHAGNTPTAPAPPSTEDSDRHTHTFAAMELPEPPPPAPPLNRLRHLATEAARQAQQLLTEGTTLETDPVADTIRLITSLPAGTRTEDAAHRLDMDPPALRRLLEAHALAGTPGVDATRHTYPDDPHALQQAAATINPLRPANTKPLITADNHITDSAADIQIRHGQDGKWYPFAASGHDWQLIAHPTYDPASAYHNALTELHTPSRSRQ